MTAITYTDAFKQFWSNFPRKTAKPTAFKAWQRQVDEGDMYMCKAIIDDLQKRTRLKWWPIDKTKIPHAATWINQRRWEDEGWEDDIKTRGKEHEPTVAPRNYTNTQEEAPKLPRWMAMLNRLFMNYLFLAGGFTEPMLKQLVKLKHEVWRELHDVAEEEIEIRDDKDAAKNEMAWLIADTMLSRMDNLTGRTLKPKVINMSRKPA